MTDKEALLIARQLLEVSKSAGPAIVDAAAVLDRMISRLSRQPRGCINMPGSVGTAHPCSEHIKPGEH